jgi:hypothetical protein
MNFSQQFGLLLSGTWRSVRGLPHGPRTTTRQPTGPTVPVHEAPPQSWPEPPKAPAGAPNVVLILIDDVGFGATSALLAAQSTHPNFERLAQRRSALQQLPHERALLAHARRAADGRNNHQVGFGSIAEWSAPYPGYNTVLPKSAATIAEVLKENGYSTSAYGKWHNTPMWQVSASRTIRPLAHGPRLRTLLRLQPGRRQPVLSPHL